MRSHTGDPLAKHPQQACPTPGTRGRNSAIHLDNWGVLGKGGSRAVTSPGVTGSMWRGMGTGYRTRDVITLAAPCMYPTLMEEHTIRGQVTRPGSGRGMRAGGTQDKCHALIARSKQLGDI